MKSQRDFLVNYVDLQMSIFVPVVAAIMFLLTQAVGRGCLRGCLLSTTPLPLWGWDWGRVHAP